MGIQWDGTFASYARVRWAACPATTSHGRVRHPNHASGTSAADPRHHVDGLLVRKSPDVIDEVCMQ